MVWVGYSRKHRCPQVVEILGPASKAMPWSSCLWTYQRTHRVVSCQTCTAFARAIMFMIYGGHIKSLWEYEFTFKCDIIITQVWAYSRCVNACRKVNSTFISEIECQNLAGYFMGARSNVDTLILPYWPSGRHFPCCSMTAFKAKAQVFLDLLRKLPKN